MKTYLSVVVSLALCGTPASLTSAQTPAKSAASTHTSSNPVDDVIKLVKSGMSEDLILKSLRKRNQPIVIQTGDLVRLKDAGVSDAIISVMEDPTSSPGSNTPPPIAQPTPAQPSPVTSAPTPATTVPSPALSPAVAAPPSDQRKRVAVYPFDYSAVMNATQSIFGTQQNIGDGIRSMLQMRLSQQGRVVVVERGKIDGLLKEQDSAAGSRMKPGSGPRIGRVVGADAILAGDIVIFGRDDKSKGGGVGALVGSDMVGGFCTWCSKGAGAASAFKKDEKAVVVINYRLIDAETSEIVASGEKRGESKRTSKNWGGFAAGWAGGGGGGLDMTSSNFDETIIGEATQDCVNQIADEFTARTEAMTKSVREVEALVASVNGNSLILNAGSVSGVNAGETFEILHVDQEVKDPVTKEVLDKIVSKVGECRIESVRDKISTCTYAGAPVVVGMVARKKL
jgi:curli biogenesis system outer membrane secretion channel CsgG